MGWESFRIVVAGVCASGKTTLVEGLRARGWQARSVAQEHSGVPRLWAVTRPDFLIVLDSNLDTIKRRRKVPWGEERLKVQRWRLRHARENCDLFLPTDHLTPGEMIAGVTQILTEYIKGGGFSSDNYPDPSEGP